METLGEKIRKPKGEGETREERRKPREHAVCPESQTSKACQGARYGPPRHLLQLTNSQSSLQFTNSLEIPKGKLDLIHPMETSAKKSVY